MIIIISSSSSCSRGRMAESTLSTAVQGRQPAATSQQPLSQMHTNAYCNPIRGYLSAGGMLCKSDKPSIIIYYYLLTSFDGGYFLLQESWNWVG